jgi:hypothetical protein
MGTVWHVVAFDHLLVREALAFFADTTGPDRLEEGLPMLVLLLHELRVVVELIVRGTDGPGITRLRRRWGNRTCLMAKRDVPVSSSMGTMVSLNRSTGM